MALQISFTDATIAGGFTFPQAYCSIDGWTMPNINGELDVVVAIYADKAHFTAGSVPIFRKTVVLTPADLATLLTGNATTVYGMLTATLPAPGPYPPFTGGVQVP